MPPCRRLILVALSTALIAVGCNSPSEPAAQLPEPAAKAPEPAAEAPETPARVTKPVAKAPVPAPEATQLADPGPGALILGVASMRQVDDRDPKRGQRLELTADGTITSRSMAIAKVTPDGRMIVDGVEFLTLQRDDTVHLKGKPSGLRLEPGGARAMVEDGFTLVLQIADDGAMVASSADEKPIDGATVGDARGWTSTGCTGPMARTCAFAMLGLVLFPDALDTLNGRGFE